MVVKRDPHRGAFGQSVGKEVVTGVFGGGGFSGGRGSGVMGRKTSQAAKSAQSGSDLAKNFRASGKAGTSTSTSLSSKKTYQKSKISKFLGF